MLSDEEREAINHLTEKMKYHKDNPLGTYVWLTLDEHYVRTILNLIKKQSKEIEEYKKQLDLDYVDKHFVPIERYNQLEKEIEGLKEIYQTGYVNGCVSKVYEINKKWEDTIKAKIEEYKKQQKEEPDAYLCIKVLQSLLEKE